MTVESIIPERVVDLVYVAGAEVVVLKEQYDRRQLFLPLGTVFVFEAESRPQAVPYARHKFNNRAYAKIDETHRIMYPRDHAAHAKQYVLPYAEHKRMNNGAMKALKKHGFPLWDKTCDFDTKNPFECLNSLEVINFHRPDIEAWCDSNLRGRYFIRDHRVIYFELSFDAMMAKMYFT